MWFKRRSDASAAEQQDPGQPAVSVTQADGGTVVADPEQTRRFLRSVLDSLNTDGLK